MTPLLQANQLKQRSVHAFSVVLTLDDGAQTLVHVVRYDKAAFYPKIVVFDEATPLLSWCRKHDISEAMSGGFYVRSAALPLGDVWVDGLQSNSVPFDAPWGGVRASLEVTDNNLNIGLRSYLSIKPTGSLLQAGPLLVQQGEAITSNTINIEGFAVDASQFDSDITDGRYPRAALGHNDRYMWSVTCDGSSADRQGLSMSEMAQIMCNLGAQEALNLDGGGSTSQISAGQMRNHPYGDGRFYEFGRPIHTAIAFLQVER